MLITVREYITNKNGKQFDPVLVNLILKNWDGIYTLYQDSLGAGIRVHVQAYQPYSEMPLSNAKNTLSSVFIGNRIMVWPFLIFTRSFEFPTIEPLSR